MKEKVNLRLIGNSLEDLSTFSAYLQDSLVKIKDIFYLKKNRIFILLLNRFMWEDVERGIFRDYKRIQCIVRFIGILKVISKNINQKKKDRLLELLTISTVINKNEVYEIKLIFSGNSTVVLFAEQIDILFEDVGDPRVVKNYPKHRL